MDLNAINRELTLKPEAFVLQWPHIPSVLSQWRERQRERIEAEEEETLP